jgi:hypothetical protein
MIELPEAIVIAKQINDTLKGKTIEKAIRGHTPHTFIFPQDRDKMSENQRKDFPYQLGEEYKDELFTKIMKGKIIKRSWANGNAILILSKKKLYLKNTNFI